MRRMRWLLCGLAVIGMAPQARAADLSDMFLRGSSTVITAPARRDLGRLLCRRPGRRDRTRARTSRSATRSLIQFMLRETTIENEQPVSDWRLLGKADTTASALRRLHRLQLAVGRGRGRRRRTLQPHRLSSVVDRRDAPHLLDVSTVANDIQVNGTASVRMTDYGTVRARGGWAIGNFMPYGTLGLAVGRADVIALGDRSTARDPANSAIILFQDTAIRDQGRHVRLRLCGRLRRRHGVDAERVRARRIRIREVRLVQRHQPAYP